MRGCRALANHSIKQNIRGMGAYSRGTMRRRSTNILIFALMLALAACSRKRSPRPRHSASRAPVATPATPTPTAAPVTPTAEQPPAETPTALAVSRVGVFVGTSSGNVEKRPLGSGASAPLSAEDASHIIAKGDHVVALSAALNGSLLAVTHSFRGVRSVWLYDQATLAVRGQLPGADGSRRLMLSADGRLLMAYGASITLWGTANSAKLADVAAEDPEEVRMNAAGTLLAIKQQSNPAFERPMKGGGHEWIMPSSDISVMQRDGTIVQRATELYHVPDYALSPDGRLLIIGNTAGGIDVLGRGVAPKKSAKLGAKRLAVSHDSKRAAVARREGRVLLVDLLNPSKTSTLPSSGEPRQMAFAAGDRALYVMTEAGVEVLPIP